MVPVRLEKACTGHHLAMSLSVIWILSSFYSIFRNLICKTVACLLRVFVSRTRQPWGNLCYLAQEENVAGRDHARLVATACFFAAGARVQLKRGGGAMLAAAANPDYLVPLCKTSRLVPFRLLPPCHSYPPVLQFQQWVTQRFLM